jgi:hypothetical protein
MQQPHSRRSRILLPVRAGIAHVLHMGRPYSGTMAYRIEHSAWSIDNIIFQERGWVLDSGAQTWSFKIKPWE